MRFVSINGFPQDQNDGSICRIRIGVRVFEAHRAAGGKSEPYCLHSRTGIGIPQSATAGGQCSSHGGGHVRICIALDFVEEYVDGWGVHCSLRSRVWDQSESERRSHR